MVHVAVNGNWFFYAITFNNTSDATIVGTPCNSEFNKLRNDLIGSDVNPWAVLADLHSYYILITNQIVEHLAARLVFL